MTDPSARHGAVSVVIPALDEEAYLPELLDALARQSYPVREIFVADAGSHDRTPEIARRAGAAVVPGGMPADGRNAGAARASGDWLLFLDADLQMEPDALETALDAMARRRLDGASVAFVPDVRTPFLRLIHAMSSWHFRITTALRWPHAIGGFLLVRRAMHQELGGFDTTITVAEDQDYVRRMQRAGRYAFLMKPVVQVAARRFLASGGLKMSVRWIVIEAHRLLLGEIRHHRIRYFEERRDPEPGLSRPADG